MSIILAQLMQNENNAFLIEAAIQYLNSLEGNITGKYLLNNLKGRINDATLESILYELETLEAIEFNPTDGQKGFMNYSFKVHPYKLREVFHDTRIAISILKEINPQKEKDKFKIVVTLPADPDFEGINIPGVRPLFPALHELIVMADKELIIVSPFFEIKGMSDLFNALMASACRGTRIQIISREIKNKDKPNYKVLKELYNKTMMRGIEGKFKYYEYQAESEEDSPPEFTLHAKIILADNKAAYIGSANLTRYGFGKYLEVGVVIEGKSVNSVKTIINKLMISKAIAEINFSKI